MTVAATAGRVRRPVPAIGMLLAVLGVVYGDIGTSPLYAFKASMQCSAVRAITAVEVLGILSLIFWSLVLIVTVKYVMLIMRADNRGEGGILALMALAQRVSVGTGVRKALALVGIAGACLFFGDGVITPAISVLSAVEGLEVAAPGLQEYVLPISVVGHPRAVRRPESRHRQRRPVVRPGDGAVVRGHRRAWARCRSCSIPYRAAGASRPAMRSRLCMQYKALAFVVLGAVVLCVTGAEALYADMGHFGAQPIRLTWSFFVLPCLVLNYFGQGALVHQRSRRRWPIRSILLAPHWYGCRW